MKYVKRAVRSIAPKKKRMMKRKPRMTSLAKLTRQVKKLQSQNDGEKKRTSVLSAGEVGQVNVNSDGALVVDVTPIVGQGVQTNQRTGASIRLHSSNYNFQLSQMSGCNTRIRYRISWLAVTGASYASSTIVSQFFNNVYQPNAFISGSIRDYNCQKNPDYFGTYKIIRTIQGTIEPDSFSGMLTSRSFNVGLKYNKGKGHDVRYNQNLTGADGCFNGQIIMVIQLDRGNASTLSASTTTGALDTAVNTGIYCQYNRYDYYYDN